MFRHSLSVENHNGQPEGDRRGKIIYNLRALRYALKALSLFTHATDTMRRQAAAFLRKSVERVILLCYNHQKRYMISVTDKSRLFSKMQSRNPDAIAGIPKNEV